MILTKSIHYILITFKVTGSYVIRQSIFKRFGNNPIVLIFMLGLNGYIKKYLERSAFGVFKDADLKRFCDEEEAMTDMYV